MAVALSKRTRRELAKAFKLNGLTVSGDALKGVWRQLAREEDTQAKLQLIIDRIKTHLKQSKERAAVVVGVDIVEKVVADLSKDDDDRVDQSLQLFSAFEHVNLAYKSEKHEFFIIPKSAAALNGVASQKTDMYRTRLSLVQQRTLRNPLFRAPTVATSRTQGSDFLTLCPVESLIGTTGTQCVLGMLFRHNGELFLEDFNSKIRLIFTEDSKIFPGVFTETCIVLVEGEYFDGTLVVKTCGLPPSEPRADTLPVLGNVSMLGLDFNSEAYANIERVESTQDAPPIVVLSEVHLDRPEVLDQLRRLFDGLGAMSPSLIVFMGNFSAQPFGNSYADRGLSLIHI